MAGDSKGPMGHPDHVSERTIAITGGDAGYFDLIERLRRLAARDGGRSRAGARHPRLRFDGGATRLVPRSGSDAGRAAVGLRLSRSRQAEGWLQGADGAAFPAALLSGLRSLSLDRRRLLGAAGRCDHAVPAGRAYRRARGGAGDPSLHASLSPRLGRVLVDQRCGLRSVLRQGDGRAADPLSLDQCRRLRAQGRRAALGRLGRRAWARPCSARPT